LGVRGRLHVMTSTNRIDHQELEVRRLRAAELFAAGVGQAEVARRLGATRQSVHRWHACWREGGVQALASRGPTGYRPHLSDQDLGRLIRLLLQGAAAHGFTGELWTVARIGKFIDREFGVAYHPSHVWWLLRHRLGWSPQRPVRQAKERDQAAVQRWVDEDWPRIKANARRRKAWSSWTSRA
jgi:transposase